MNEHPSNRPLDWLDRRTAWQFVLFLYVARWVVLAPVSMLTDLAFTDAQKSAATIPEQWSEGTPIGLFLGLVVIPPLLETLLEFL
jgi:hypothetical protein